MVGMATTTNDDSLPRSFCAVDIGGGNDRDDDEEGWDGGDGDYDKQEEGRRQNCAIIFYGKTCQLSSSL